MNFEETLAQSLREVQSNMADVCNRLINVSPPTSAALMDYSILISSAFYNALLKQSKTKTLHFLSLLKLNVDVPYEVNKVIYAYLKYSGIRALHVPKVAEPWVVDKNHVYLEKNNTNDIPDFTYRIVFQFNSWSDSFSFNGAYFDIKAPLSPDRYSYPLTVQTPEEQSYFDTVLAGIVGMPKKYLSTTFDETLNAVLETVKTIYSTVPVEFELRLKGESDDNCVVHHSLTCIFEELLDGRICHLGSSEYHIRSRLSYSNPTVFAVGNQKVVAVPYGYKYGTIDRHLYIALDVTGEPKLLPVKEYFIESGFNSNFNLFVLVDLLERLAKIN